MTKNIHSGGEALKKNCKPLERISQCPRNYELCNAARCVEVLVERLIRWCGRLKDVPRILCLDIEWSA